jgi:hypothetical protein
MHHVNAHSEGVLGMQAVLERKLVLRLIQGTYFPVNTFYITDATGN